MPWHLVTAADAFLPPRDLWDMPAGHQRGFAFGSLELSCHFVKRVKNAVPTTLLPLGVRCITIESGLEVLHKNAFGGYKMYWGTHGSFPLR